MTGGGDADYYLERKEKYWRQLQRLFKSSRRMLPGYVDADVAAKAGDETYREFEGMLSALPYIGGDRNMLTFTLISSAAALAYMRVLEGYGLSGDAVGEILDAVYGDALARLPRVVKWWLRRREFSGRHQRALRAYAKRSQMRQYPGDWVMHYVEGDGETFDFGCDYTECAVLKSFRQVGAEAYMPYVCVMDFTMSRALRTGLHRTSTLHYGGDCCDFRFKKNRVGQPGLPIEDLPEYQNRSV